MISRRTYTTAAIAIPPLAFGIIVGTATASLALDLQVSNVADYTAASSNAAANSTGASGPAMVIPDLAAIDAAKLSEASSPAAIEAVESNYRYQRMRADTVRLRSEVDRLRQEVASTPGRHALNGKQIALTFDDGPAPVWSDRVLDILDKYDIKATFFVLGRSTVTWPETVQRMHENGHSVQNHSWSHPQLNKIGKERAMSELERTSDAIVDAIGIPPTCFRPPYGATNDKVRSWADELGMTEMMWTDDTMDWSSKATSDDITNWMNSQPEGPKVVLMHDGPGRRTATVDSLEPIIESYLDKGYTFVTLCAPGDVVEVTSVR